MNENDKLNSSMIIEMDKTEEDDLLEKLNLEEHLEPKNLNKVIGVENDIFQVMPTGLKENSMGNISPFLIRNQTQILLDTLNKKQWDRRILIGSSGAGKSYILFHLAYYHYHLPDWIVLYIPNMATLYNNPNHSVAQQIMNRMYLLYKTQLFEKYKFKFDEEFWRNPNPSEKEKKSMISQCLNLFSALTNGVFLNHKIFIALDQWNILFRDEKMNQDNHILNFFREFGEIPNGVFVTAVSSSFEPIDRLHDADYVTLIFRVSVYDKAELSAMIKYNIKRKNLPEKVNIEHIQHLTGNVPRILFFLCQAFKNPKRSQNWEKDAHQATMKYYRDRIFHILSKSQSQQKLKNSQIQHDSLQFAMLLYLNKDLPTLPNQWEMLGIFTEIDDKRCTFICDWAKEAFYQTINDNIYDYLEVLSMDSQTKARAFELFVSSSFIKSIQGITLKTTNLRGEKTDPSELEIEVNKFVTQEKNKPLQIIDPGTFIICYEGHPVVDFVAFSLKKQLFYIQASVSPYQEHPKKMPDLWESLFESTQQSIYEYYSQLTGLSNKKISKTKLPQNQFYLYITSNPHFMIFKSKYSGHQVHLVNRDELSSLNLTSWSKIKKYFSKSN
ncbi:MITOCHONDRIAL 28S ribosomal protein S29 [Anaeramoeba ignava]|uniref:Small ribosomal subunit protein mS29 n=1 Tax=Anaeramoeba ignava TaxID=1746090 RepID=A0A9Q0L994_ANAIG|nr:MITOCHONDRIAL 28S ribosomal protein S29 [Anaeramoeba ignava]